MNNKILFLFKEHTDTLIEQTKTKPQETLEFKLDKDMETFSFIPPINISDEGTWWLAVTSFWRNDLRFLIPDETNSV